jgi:hypothetical protein
MSMLLRIMELVHAGIQRLEPIGANGDDQTNPALQEPAAPRDVSGLDGS